MSPAELRGGACDAGGRGHQTPAPCLPGRFLSLQVIIPTEHKACHRCPKSAVSVTGGTNPPPPGVSVWPHGSDTPSQAGAAQQGHQPHSASPLSRLYPLLTLPQCLLSPPRVPSPRTCTGPHSRGGRMLGECRPPSPAGAGAFEALKDNKDTPALAPSRGAHPAQVALHLRPCVQLARPAPSFSPVALTLTTVSPGPDCLRMWDLT